MPQARRFADHTWSEVEALERHRLVAILPIGAVEAHGPHLPLATDGIIATAMAEAAARRLSARHLRPEILPALDYSAAPFAAGFPGTISVRPGTVQALVEDVAASLASQEVPVLALANAHLDPAHLGSLHAAVAAVERTGAIRLAFPDLTEKPWALRLTEEFRSGACHAGRFEASVVMAARPELVREGVRERLEANPRSLSRAIRDGKASFEEAGGPLAYFGDPAAASREEGRDTIETLGSILEEAVLAAIGS